MLGVLRGLRQAGVLPVVLRNESRGLMAGQRRLMSDEVKLNCWEAPTNVAKWKEEHIVLVVLGAWGVGIYAAMKKWGGDGDNVAADGSLPPVALDRPTVPAVQAVK